MVQTWGAGILSAFILLSVIDDIRSRKVHNSIVLTALFSVLIFRGLFDFSGLLTQGALAFFVSLAIGLVLWKLRVLGAGDVKLFSVLALATNLTAAGQIALYTLVWGGVLAVIQILLKGSLFKTIFNLSFLRVDKSEYQAQVPFTVAILLGWAQWMIYQGML